MLTRHRPQIKRKENPLDTRKPKNVGYKAYMSPFILFLHTIVSRSVKLFVKEPIISTSLTPNALMLSRDLVASQPLDSLLGPVV